VGATRTILDPTDTLGHKNLYIDILTRKALDRMLDIDNALVIDLGCGSGRLFDLFSSKARAVIGLDKSYELLKFAKRAHERFDVIHFDGENLPVRKNHFDAVISVWCLQYMMRDRHFEHVVAQIASCLKIGGKAYLIERAMYRKSDWARKEHEYIDAFVKYGCRCNKSYPIRNTRSLMLYLIRYGFVPRKFFPALAERELRTVKSPPPWYVKHQDQAFVFERIN
jgi:SAM-dependent methyltransferase